MFKKIGVFTSGCCLLALSVFLLQACFFPLVGTGDGSTVSVSGLWEGTLTFTSGGGGWAGVSTTFMITFVEPDAGGITGSAKLSHISEFYGLMHDVGAVFGTRSGNILTLYIGHWMGAGTYKLSGTVSGGTISGTLESAQELDPHGETKAGTWQVTRTYPYYTKAY